MPPADDGHEEVVGHVLTIIANRGQVGREGDDVVYADRVVEIRLTRIPSRTVVRRLRGGVSSEVLVLHGDGHVESGPDLPRVLDHIAEVAEDCEEEEAMDEAASTPLRAEDVEAMIAMEDPEAQKEEHLHVEYVPECHPASDLSVYYCDGVLHVDCSACHKPRAAFLVARRNAAISAAGRSQPRRGTVH